MRQSKLAWWQLWVLIPLGVGLLVFEGWSPLSGVSVGLADLAIVAFAFGAMFIWVQIHQGELESYYMEQDGDWDLVIVPDEPAQPAEIEPCLHAPSTALAYAALSRPEKEEEGWSRN